MFSGLQARDGVDLTTELTTPMTFGASTWEQPPDWKSVRKWLGAEIPRGRLLWQLLASMDNYLTKVMMDAYFLANERYWNDDTTEAGYQPWIDEVNRYHY